MKNKSVIGPNHVSKRTISSGFTAKLKSVARGSTFTTLAVRGGLHSMARTLGMAIRIRAIKGSNQTRVTKV